MAATKATGSLTASTASGTSSSYASPTSGCQSSWIALTTVDSCLFTGLMTNGGTGPTIGCSCQIDTSPDNGTTIRQYATIVGGVTASALYPINVTIPGAALYARITFFGNTGQTVTCISEYSTVVF
jgi:hypothetical protein